MKRYLALAGMTLAVCALACAQEVSTGDRVVVPARNSTRPRLVDAAMTNGSITVKTYAGNEVIVEASGRSSRGRRERTYEGLRRIDVPPGGLEVDEEDNVVTVRMRGAPSADLTITVPVNTSLRLKSTNGSISADGVHGEIDASTTNGRVNLMNVSGTVVTDSHNGAVKVVMDRVEPGKPISFSSFNGDIDVTLPADFKANLKLRANRGEIYSDFDMKLTPGGNITERNDTPEGRYRVRVDRMITGSINGGGTEASFSTFNGKILIRKK
jgi:hypothetical protein